MERIQFVCAICLNATPTLYSISQCQHTYCMECCQNHICQSISNFVKVTCPSGQKCNNSTLDQNCLPYQLLQQAYKDKYTKWKRFQYFQKNPTIRSCKIQDCSGEINLARKDMTCNVCHRTYCERCLQFSHLGECSKDQGLMMSALNFKQCSQCRIYVEKVDGCNYISCTCGNHFCYTCGAPWRIDPCRLKQFAIKNQEIRTILRQTKLNKRCDSSLGFLKAVILTTFQLLLIPLWIIVGALCLPLIMITLTLALYVLLSPLVIIIMVTVTITWTRKHIIFIILILALYPLIAALMLLLLVVFAIMYVCVRDRFEFHHGIYDPIIQLSLGYVIWFLTVFKAIVTM